MNEIIQKIQQAMNIAASLKPRVDQVNEITLPLVQVVNLLAEARDKLKRLDEQKEEAASETPHPSPAETPSPQGEG